MESLNEIKQERDLYKKLVGELTLECEKLGSEIWLCDSIKAHRDALLFKNKQLEKELKDLRGIKL